MFIEILSEIATLFCYPALLLMTLLFVISLIAGMIVLMK